MLLSQILSGDSNQTIEEKGYLEITKNTVKFGDNVYQFRNVAGFGVGQVKTKGISIAFIISLCLVALFLPNTRLGALSFVFWILAIASVAYNLTRPKLYGLSLYVNSGHERIFVTYDMEFLTKVVRTLKEFMENLKEGKTINISIGKDMRGNITIGDIHGDVSNS